MIRAFDYVQPASALTKCTLPQAQACETVMSLRMAAACAATAGGQRPLN